MYPSSVKVGEDRVEEWQRLMETGRLSGERNERIPVYDGNHWNEQKDKLRDTSSEDVPDKPVYQFYQAAALHRGGTICETLKEYTSGVFRTEHPNLTLLINSHRDEHGAVSKGWNCTHARAEFSRIRLVKVVEKAQEIAVDFCLECEERSIDIVHEHGGDNERWIKALDAGALEAAKTIGRVVVMRLLG